ncbi:hypothetical protein [Salinilacihabitans rarus]|uniref:hypothetical protein n=1 Tax=Salinilacihabitans rarus TaxID=2961596 RepID=UPI003CCD5167
MSPASPFAANGPVERLRIDVVEERGPERFRGVHRIDVLDDGDRADDSRFGTPVGWTERSPPSQLEPEFV